MGQLSKLNNIYIVEALFQRLIYYSKSYKELELQSILSPIVSDLINDIESVKVMEYFLEALYDAKQIQSLTDNFFKAREQNKLINMDKFNELNQFIFLNSVPQNYPLISASQISPFRSLKKIQFNNNYSLLSIMKSKELQYSRQKFYQMEEHQHKIITAEINLKILNELQIILKCNFQHLEFNSDYLIMK